MYRLYGFNTDSICVYAIIICFRVIHFRDHDYGYAENSKLKPLPNPFMIRDRFYLNLCNPNTHASWDVWPLHGIYIISI